MQFAALSPIQMGLRIKSQRCEQYGIAGTSNCFTSYVYFVHL